MIGDSCKFAYIVCLALLTGAITEAASLELRLTTAHGKTTQQAVAGELYHVEVCVGQNGTISQRPLIPGLLTDYIQGSSERRESSWLQGSATHAVTFITDVIWPQPGTVTLGPVEMMIDGHVVHSNSLTITVVNSADGARPRPGTPHHTYAEWELSRADAYIGEGVACRLCLYTTDDSVQLEGISQFQPDRYQLKLSEPTWESRVKKGKRYYVAVWEGILYPQVAGDIWLPAMLVVYRSPGTAGQQGFFAMMPLFAQVLSHQVRAAALKLMVKPLPPTDKKIAGVGVIKKIGWHVSQEKASQGAAVVATRTITGSFNPTMLTLDLPPHSDNLRVYKSGSKTMEAYPEHVMTDEYVVQGLREGWGELDAQTYWFFNPERAVYEGITTPPVRLEILPSSHMTSAGAQEPDEPKLDAGAATTEEQPLIHQKDEYMCNGLWCYRMPLPLFLFLVILPLSLRAMRDPLRARYASIQRRLKIRSATRRMQRALSEARRVGDRYRLHAALGDFLQSIVTCNESASLRDILTNWLEKRGCTTAQRDEWNRFFSEVEKSAYAPTITQESWKLLSAQAESWVKFIAQKARETV